MNAVKLLLDTERFQRIDRDGRVRDEAIDRLRRWSLAPSSGPCCPPPCCSCCWDAV